MSDQETVIATANAADEKRQRINQIFDELKKIHETAEAIEVEISSVVKGGFKTLYKELPIFLPFKLFSKTRHFTDEEAQNEIGKTIRVIVVDFTEDEFAKVAKISKVQFDENEKWKAIANGLDVDVTVKIILAHGIVFSLENGLEGYAPANLLSKYQAIDDPHTFAQVGDKFRARIINADKLKGRILLSLKTKQHVPDWHNLYADFAVGKRVKGTVKKITNDGFVVTISENIDGFVRNSEISWTKRPQNLNETFAVGQELEAEIIALNPDEGRIALSYRRTLPNNWAEVAEKYAVGEEYAGIVTAISKNGVTVCLNDEIEGFMPKARMQALLNGDKIMLNNFDLVKIKIANKDAEKYFLIFESALQPPKSEIGKQKSDGRFSKYGDKTNIPSNAVHRGEYSFADLLSEASKKNLKKL